MPKPRSSKRDIDRTKRERAAAKRQRRQSTEAAAPVAPDADDVRTETMSEAEVLAALDELHVRFDADELDFEEFSATKADLLGQLANGGDS